MSMELARPSPLPCSSAPSLGQQLGCRKQSPGQSLSHVLGLSLLCPQSISEEGLGHSFIFFSIEMQVCLMLIADFLSPCPLFHFLVFPCPDSHHSNWGFLEGCLCNLMLNWAWWCNLGKWSKWRAQILSHCLILGCALWCVTWKVKVKMVHCLSQSFLLVNLCFLPPIQLKFQKPMGQTFSWSKLS